MPDSPAWWMWGGNWPKDCGIPTEDDGNFEARRCPSSRSRQGPHFSKTSSKQVTLMGVLMGNHPIMIVHLNLRAQSHFQSGWVNKASTVCLPSKEATGCSELLVPSNSIGCAEQSLWEPVPSKSPGLSALQGGNQKQNQKDLPKGDGKTDGKASHWFYPLKEATEPQGDGKTSHFSDNCCFWREHLS